MSLKNLKKLHVLFTKEDINTEKIDDDKVAIVFDVLLATTTISALLYYGATKIIPVLDESEANKVKGNHHRNERILTGELGGKTIAGFMDPLPTQLKSQVNGKTVVLSTTNGTVAIRNVQHAKKVYAASIPNVIAVAQKILDHHENDTVIVICAGSTGRFALEDFYGAGYFIHTLTQLKQSWELTDSAKAALYFYQGNKSNAINILKTSEIGKIMIAAGLEEDVRFAAEKGVIPIVPELMNGMMIVNPDGKIKEGVFNDSNECSEDNEGYSI